MKNDDLNEAFYGCSTVLDWQMIFDKDHRKIHVGHYETFDEIRNFVSLQIVLDQDTVNKAKV